MGVFVRRGKGLCLGGGRVSQWPQCSVSSCPTRLLNEGHHSIRCFKLHGTYIAKVETTHKVWMIKKLAEPTGE